MTGSSGLGLKICSAGGVVSLTVTENDPDAVLPRVSDAVQNTPETPKRNREPDGCEHMTGLAPSTLSIADTGKTT